MGFDRSDASRLLRFSAQATSLLCLVCLGGAAISVGLASVSENLIAPTFCAAFACGIVAERWLMLRRLRENYPDVVASGAANAMALASVASRPAAIVLALIAGLANVTLAPVAVFAGFVALAITLDLLAAAFGLWITRRTEAILD